VTPAALAAVAALAALGCESRAPEPDANVDADAERVHDPLPDALLVRFRTTSGTGLSKEGWEIEVLQMGGEVRVRGAVRTAGASVPIYRVMDSAEYLDFWQWLSAFPLDRHRVEEDPSAPPTEWRKSLEVDVVLGPERRLLAENEWTRPLLFPAWLMELEDRLHLLVLDYANEALDEPPTTEETSDEVGQGVQRALDTLDE
jgi:hypothetical protein